MKLKFQQYSFTLRPLKKSVHPQPRKCPGLVQLLLNPTLLPADLSSVFPRGLDEFPQPSNLHPRSPLGILRSVRLSRSLFIMSFFFFILACQNQSRCSDLTSLRHDMLILAPLLLSLSPLSVTALVLIHAIITSRI